MGPRHRYTGYPMTWRWLKLSVKGLGPIHEASLTIKPLSIVIGRNCIGKSLLVDLAYLLSNTLPDFHELRKSIGFEAGEEAERALKVLREGDVNAAGRHLTRLLHLHFEGIKRALEASLTRRFKEFFNVKRVGELFKGVARIEGHEALTCRVKAEDDSLKVDFKGYEGFEVVVRDVMSTGEGLQLEASLNYRGSPWMDKSWSHQAEDVGDLLRFISGLVLPSALADLSPLSFAAIDSYLLTDSRAGILRLARAALSKSLEYGGLVVPAKESSFLAAHEKLVRRFRDYGLKGELKEHFQDFLTEAGIKSVDIRLVAGYPEVVVEDRWGRKLPLEECPSGIRESLTIALALVANVEGLEAIFVEEVESHLHPKALDRMLRLAWKSLLSGNRALYLIITTHNPLVLSVVNNLVMKTEQGHELVSITYLREMDGVVKSEEIEVSEKGFDETALSAIFTELLEERAELS